MRVGREVGAQEVGGQELELADEPVELDEDVEPDEEPEAAGVLPDEPDPPLVDPPVSDDPPLSDEPLESDELLDADSEEDVVDRLSLR